MKNFMQSKHNKTKEADFPFFHYFVEIWLKIWRERVEEPSLPGSILDYDSYKSSALNREDASSVDYLWLAICKSPEGFPLATNLSL